MSDTHTLFALDFRNWILYALQSGESNAQTYDLTPYEKTLSWPLMNFVPFGDTSALFFGADQRLYKYDLTTRTLIAVTLKPDTRLISCGYPYFSPLMVFDPSIMRLEDNMLLACSTSASSKQDEISYNVETVNVLNGTVNTLYSVSDRPIAADYRPWSRLRVGHDGLIYSEGAELGSDLKPEQLFIKQRDKQNNWHTFKIVVADVVGWDTGRMAKDANVFNALITVDSDSNVYVDFSWSRQSEQHFRLAKFSPQGQLIGIITEKDFGGIVPNFIDVTDNGHLIVEIHTTSNSYAVEEVTLGK